MKNYVSAKNHYHNVAWDLDLDLDIDLDLNLDLDLECDVDFWDINLL